MLRLKKPNIHFIRLGVSDVAPHCQLHGALLPTINIYTFWRGGTPRPYIR